MSITKKLQIKKAQWKEFVRCIKMLRDASANVARAENEIHLKKYYKYDINETGWENGSCLVTHIYPGHDVYGNQETMRYDDVCEHFECCKCDKCIHYHEWRKYQDARKSCELAKIAFGIARQKFFAKVK